MASEKQLPLAFEGHKVPVISDDYDPKADAVLFHGDRLDLLRHIKYSGDTATLIVTSPPYNIGKEYEEGIAFDEYVEEQKQTIAACCEVLSPRGSICWQVGNYIEGSFKTKEIYPLDLVLYPIFKSLVDHHSKDYG